MSAAPVIFTETVQAASERWAAFSARDKAQTESPIRRPLRGIQLKPQTFAQLSMEDYSFLLDSSGTVPMGSPSNNNPVRGSIRYANFILQGMSIEASEKFQQVLTFGLTYGFFFGQNPHIYSFEAVLVDSADFPWVVDWLENYSSSFRGTRAVLQNNRVRMAVEEHEFLGYILNFGLRKGADAPHEVRLTFTMWVTEENSKREAGDSSFPYDPATFTVSAVTTRPSTTQAVRNANIALANKDPGKLRKLVAAVTNFISKVDQAVDGAEDFLYGRTIVKPDGPNITGQPVSQEVAQLINNTFGSFGANVTLKLVQAPEYPTRRSYFNRNLDEYIQGGFLDQYTSAADYGGLTYADGTPLNVDALVADATAQWKRKTAEIANPAVANLNTPSLMEKIGKVIATRAALLVSQVALQEITATSATSSNVDGTMVAPTPVFNATQDIAVPLLGLAYLSTTSELGVSTLTDAALRRASAANQPTQEERMAAIQAQVDANVAREASRNTPSRANRRAAIQAKVDAARDVPTTQAQRQAEREAEITASIAETRRKEQADAAARAALRQQLLGSFA